MKHYFISADYVPIYFDHKDGRMICMPLGTNLELVQENFNEQWKTVQCDKTLLVFSQKTHFYYLVVSDEGETEQYIRAQIHFITELFTLKFSPKIYDDKSLVNFTKQQEFLSSLLNTMKNMFSSKQCFLVNAIERLEVADAMRTQVILSIKALLSNSYLSVTNVIIFVGTKLLLNYARPKVSESLKTEELLLLLTLSRSHFRPIAKQFEKENIPVSDYSNHSDLSPTYIYPPDAFNDSSSTTENGDPNDDSEQNTDDINKHVKSSLNDEEYISCEEGDIPENSDMDENKRSVENSKQSSEKDDVENSEDEAYLSNLNTSDEDKIMAGQSSSPDLIKSAQYNNIVNQLQNDAFLNNNNNNSNNNLNNNNNNSNNNEYEDEIPPKPENWSSDEYEDLHDNDKIDSNNEGDDPSQQSTKKRPPLSSFVHIKIRDAVTPCWLHSYELEYPIQLMILSKPSGNAEAQDKERKEFYLLKKKIKDSLRSFMQYFITVHQTHLVPNLMSYIHLLPGLVHFIFVDRTADRVVAPIITPLCGQKFKNTPTSRNLRRILKKKIWDMVFQSQKALSNGYRTMIMTSGDFQYSYNLWFEEDNIIIPLSDKSLNKGLNATEELQRKSLPINGDFYKDLGKRLFPNNYKRLRCFELYTLYLDGVSAKTVASHNATLVNAIRNR